jgi:hypothetical protein
MFVELRLTWGDDTRKVTEYKEFRQFKLSDDTKLEELCEVAAKVFGLSGVITLKYEDHEDKITLVCVMCDVVMILFSNLHRLM